MPRHDWTRARWRKSARSGNSGNCVEVATGDALVAVRDSKDPYGGVLEFTPGQWQAFIEGTRNGEFDA